MPENNYSGPLRHERRRQLRSLILIAFAVLLFSILRTGIHLVFPAGWLRLW
jgi:hypothetical protein